MRFIPAPGLRREALHPWRAALTLVVLLTPTTGLQAQAIDLDRATVIFAEAQALAEADGGVLWGLSLAGPLLFVDPASREVVTNQPDPGGLLEVRGRVARGLLPDDVGIANTATEWSGERWTMVMWPLPVLPAARKRLLAHEMFHRLQPELGLPMGNGENGHLDEVQGRIWLRLEMRALAEALVREGDSRLEAVGDALLFRATRHAAFPDRADDEWALELNEGLAEYTGIRLSGLPEGVLADRAAVNLDGYDRRLRYARNFAYATGPAYGLLLDALVGPTWREGFDGSTPLFRMLEEAALRPNPLQVLLPSERALLYDGDFVIAEEEERGRERVERLAGFRARFLEGSVLSFSPTEDFGYSFDPNGVEALDDLGTVYDPVTIRDAWGTLTVESGGALFLRENGRVARVVVPLEGETPAGVPTGPGWTLELSAGWTATEDVRPGDRTLRPPPT